MSEVGQASVNVDENLALADGAQQTANDANSGITDINDPNKLGPAEKATLKRKYDTDVLLYGMDTKKLTDNQLSTSEIDSAMNALTAYMTPFFANMTSTETVDRDTLNTVYKNFDTADKNADSAFTNMVSSAASSATVAGSQASVAGSEAVVAGNNASSAASSAAVQASVAVSNANAANSNATSGIEVAQSAANDMAVVSEAVAALKGGSTMTLAQLENGLQTKITADDITGGGKNLIAGSATDVVIDDTVSKQGWKHTTIFSDLIAGQQYTFSSDIIVNTGSPSLIRLAEFNTATNSSSVNSNVPINNGHIQWTFTAVSGQPLLLVYAGTDGTTAGNKVTFHHYQLETGIIAHDWQQAPEDFSQLVETKTADLASIMVKDADFTAYQGMIAGEIESKVSASDLSFGGRNLILNSADLSNFPTWTVNGSKPTVSDDDSEMTIVTKHGGLNINSDNLSKDLPNIGDTVSISVEAKGTATLEFNYNNGDNYIGTQHLTISNDYKRYSAQFIWNPVTGTNQQFVIYTADSTDTTLIIRHPKIEISNVVSDYSRAPEDTQSDITQSINNIHFGFKNPNGTTFQMNLSADGTALMDFSKIMLNGATNIQDATIGTAQIADAAITNAKIGKLAVGTAQIADLAVTSAKVSEIDASLIKSGIIDTNRLDAYSIIANVINGKTITGITINTPTLNLGLNGTMTTTYNDAQPTSYYNPKKYNGTMSIKAGVFYSSGTDSFYDKTQNAWVGIDDSMGYDAGGSNKFSSELAPMHTKFDIYGSTGQVLKRSYMDAFGVYVMNGGGGTDPTVKLTGQGISSTAMISSTMGLQSDKSISNNNFYFNGGHTINSVDGGTIFFESGTSSGNSAVALNASAFNKASQLSVKTDIQTVPDGYATDLALKTDFREYRYIASGKTLHYEMGPIIDDVNAIGSFQYRMPSEYLTDDGVSISTTNMIGWQGLALQEAIKRIGELSLRITNLEMGIK